MKQKTLPLFLSGIVASLATGMLLCSCASVGRNFTLDQASSLELGAFRASDYRTAFGQPSNTKTVASSEGNFEIATYLFASANPGSTRARVLLLEFKDGVLNAYDYASSFEEDKTTFPVGNLKAVTRGWSMTQVEGLLGRPHGRARLPSQIPGLAGRATANGTEAWSYNAIEKVNTLGAAFGGNRSPSLRFMILFNQDGVVTEVEAVSQTTP